MRSRSPSYRCFKPTSFDAKTRTVDCCISKGSPVACFYGTEVLGISPEAVNLDRMMGSGIIPLLDSQQMSRINNALGRFTYHQIRSNSSNGLVRSEIRCANRPRMALHGALIGPEQMSG